MRMRSMLAIVAGLALLCAVAWVGQQHLLGAPMLLEDASTDPASAVAAVPVAAAPPDRTAVPATGHSRSRRSAATVPGISAVWAAHTAAVAGIPEVALTAYARASLMVPASCHLGWTTLAGLGWVESQHGMLGGRTLEADGRSSTPILGPALDGSGEFAALPATAASTAMTGDAQWQRAVGPMQFLPSTWLTWASDGDGDGVEDPNDIDDAAYAAARYLCASGADLTTGPGWSAAVFSYNHAQSYLDAVYAAAGAYAARTS